MAISGAMFIECMIDGVFIRTFLEILCGNVTTNGFHRSYNK
jgi:hypothetical protein